MMFSCTSLASCDALQDGPDDGPEDFTDEKHMSADFGPDGEEDPSWLKDNEAAFCFKCEHKFSSSRRRHHCRRCRNIFCGKCSEHKSKILACDVTKHVRVCTDCFMELINENRTIGETLPFLRGGDTFKMKAMMGLSSKIVSLRLMADNKTLMYEEDIRRELVQFRLTDIDDIVATSFDAFDVIASGRTHSFQADTKQTQQAWIHGLREAVNYALTPSLKQRVEQLRAEKREKLERMQVQQDQSSMEMNAAEQANSVRDERKKAREEIRQKYKLKSGSEPSTPT
jgi:hypothetical protein